MFPIIINILPKMAPPPPPKKKTTKPLNERSHVFFTLHPPPLSTNNHHSSCNQTQRPNGQTRCLWPWNQQGGYSHCVFGFGLNIGWYFRWDGRTWCLKRFHNVMFRIMCNFYIIYPIVPSSSSSLNIWNLWLPGKPIYQVTRPDPWF